MAVVDRARVIDDLCILPSHETSCRLFRRFPVKQRQIVILPVVDWISLPRIEPDSNRFRYLTGNYNRHCPPEEPRLCRVRSGSFRLVVTARKLECPASRLRCSVYVKAAAGINRIGESQIRGDTNPFSAQLEYRAYQADPLRSRGPGRDLRHANVSWHKRHGRRLRHCPRTGF